MEAVVITCDVCGQQRGETNHWFVAGHDRSNLAAGIAFGPGDSVFSDFVTVEHICGQECLHKRLSQWLENGK